MDCATGDSFFHESQNYKQKSNIKKGPILQAEVPKV